MAKTASIRFAKKVLPAEPRRSRVGADSHIKDLSNAIVTASRVTQFYYDYIVSATMSEQPVNILSHDVTQILGKMRTQKLYVCERVDLAEPAIVAASILWDLELPIRSDDGFRGFATERFLEFGTQVSKLPGFNLQWILTAITLLEQLSFDPSGVMFASTFAGNIASARNFTGSMGFVPWRDVPATLESLRLHQLEEVSQTLLAGGMKWFRPTIETIVRAAELIVDLHRNPIRAVKRSVPGRTYPVDSIDFGFDSSDFRVVSLEEFIGFAQRVADAKPRSLDELKKVTVNRSISGSFVSAE